VAWLEPPELFELLELFELVDVEPPLAESLGLPLLDVALPPIAVMSVGSTTVPVQDASSSQPQPTSRQEATEDLIRMMSSCVKKWRRRATNRYLTKSSIPHHATRRLRGGIRTICVVFAFYAF
jgi:hypothetical protein